ncbi:MAG: hypothetical protein WB502_03085 [Thermoactinomyces sp.]
MRKQSGKIRKSKNRPSCLLSGGFTHEYPKPMKIEKGNERLAIEGNDSGIGEDTKLA